MTPAERILERLDDVRPNGKARWTARCPSHADKTSSLSIREADDGRVLLHCFGGCATDAVVGAVGLELRDLFAPRASGFVSAVRRPAPRELNPGDLPQVVLEQFGMQRLVPGVDLLPYNRVAFEALAYWIADSIRPAIAQGAVIR